MTLRRLFFRDLCSNFYSLQTNGTAALQRKLCNLCRFYTAAAPHRVGRLVELLLQETKQQLEKLLPVLLHRIVEAERTCKCGGVRACLATRVQARK